MAAGLQPRPEEDRVDPLSQAIEARLCGSASPVAGLVPPPLDRKVSPGVAGHGGLPEMVRQTARLAERDPQYEYRWLGLCWELGILLGGARPWREEFRRGLMQVPTAASDPTPLFWASLEYLDGLDQDLRAATYAREVRAIAEYLERAAGLGADTETLTFDAGEVRALVERLEAAPMTAPEARPSKGPPVRGPGKGGRDPDAPGIAAEFESMIAHARRRVVGALFEAPRAVPPLGRGDPERPNPFADLLPGLSAARLAELMDTLKDERSASLARWGNPESRRGLAGESVGTMADWAVLVLGDSDPGPMDVLIAVLTDGSVFPHWQPWPEFWRALASWLLVRANGKSWIGC